MDALAAQIAIELGPRGISSNVIAPGPIRGTEGVARLIKEGQESEKSVPSGRFGTIKDTSDAVVFLFSDASSYVNGATLVGRSDPFLLQW